MVSGAYLQIDVLTQLKGLLALTQCGKSLFGHTDWLRWPLSAARSPAEKLHLVGLLQHGNSVLTTRKGWPVSRGWQQDFLLSRIILPPATPQLGHVDFVLAVQTLCSDLNLLLTCVGWTGAQVWVWRKYRRAEKGSSSLGCLSKVAEPGGLWAACLRRAGQRGLQSLTHVLLHG